MVNEGLGTEAMGLQKLPARPGLIKDTGLRARLFASQERRLSLAYYHEPHSVETTEGVI